MTVETAEAEVTTGARRCTRHPDRETLVSCGRCGRPFCPECLIHTPAGQRCYECAGVRRDYAQRVARGGFLRAFGAIVLGSAIASMAGFFGLLIGGMAGGHAGQAISPAVSRRTRWMVYVASVLVILVGALLGWSIPVFFARPEFLTRPDIFLLLWASFFGNFRFWLFLVIAAIAAYSRIR